MKGTSLAMLALLSCAGCATGPPPAVELAGASAAVQAAEPRADRCVHAARLLERAHVQLEIAQRLLARRDYERARRFFERAHADAELSLAVARRSELESRLEAVRR
jgi:hypothetical protein